MASGIFQFYATFQWLLNGWANNTLDDGNILKSSSLIEDFYPSMPLDETSRYLGLGELICYAKLVLGIVMISWEEFEFAALVVGARGLVWDRYAEMAGVFFGRQIRNPQFWIYPIGLHEQGTTVITL